MSDKVRTGTHVFKRYGGQIPDPETDPERHDQWAQELADALFPPPALRCTQQARFERYLAAVQRELQATETMNTDALEARHDVAEMRLL